MVSLSSSSIGAIGIEILRKNEGVAYSFLELLGVPCSSSSRFRFPGVVMKESRKYRLLDDCGVLEMALSVRREVLLLGVAHTASPCSSVGLGDRLLGVPFGSMSNMPSTWPSLWGVGPRPLRMKAGVGCSSFTGERMGCCTSVLSSVLNAFPRGVVVAAFGARSLSALSGMVCLREPFLGVSTGCLTSSGQRRELNRLYFAAISTLLLMSAREGLRPSLSSLN